MIDTGSGLRARGTGSRSRQAVVNTKHSRREAGRAALRTGRPSSASRPASGPTPWTIRSTVRAGPQIESQRRTGGQHRQEPFLQMGGPSVEPPDTPIPSEQGTPSGAVHSRDAAPPAHWKGNSITKRSWPFIG
ncbi:hypothetical protein C4L39_25735 [Clostridium diolis]|nr:hypothetical protein C4L39_25735 [Clostridium diolis]